MKIVFRVIYGLVFLSILYKIATKITPDIVDKGNNSVALVAPYSVDDQSQSVHKNIPFIADLHCDVLLWARDITEQADFDGSVTTHFDVSGMALLTAELISFGYDQLQINQIMGGNVERFLLANLPR
jgi:hypothetical protein